MALPDSKAKTVSNRLDEILDDSLCLVKDYKPFNKQVPIIYFTNSNSFRFFLDGMECLESIGENSRLYSLIDTKNNKILRYQITKGEF